ncbi:ion transporter [Streptosporangium sp. NPDC004379]|uniref:ion transporter n=1 Tax=Streptosporangium sp. NPDC004379 TaxID=3366189 RepID=UPI0036ABF825
MTPPPTDAGRVPTRERVRRILETPRLQRVIIFVIVLNAVTIGCETSSVLADRVGGLLHVIDRVTLAVFAAELAARLYAYREKFFRDPWSWFDTIVVAVSFAPASASTSVLRTLRIVRTLRLVSAVPSLRRIIDALMAAAPGMLSIVGLIVLLVYVSAVLATHLFRDIAPQYFAELPTSLFTLFQVMTGEAWPDIASEVMEQKPWAWVFFVGYIPLTTFVVLNLFIAVVVTAMDDQTTSAEEQRVEDTLAVIAGELARLHAKIDELQASAGDHRPNGRAAAEPSETTGPG